jgi:hypothetical protein
MNMKDKNIPAGESNELLNCKSRMRREFHVRFCEGVGVKALRSTRPFATFGLLG